MNKLTLNNVSWKVFLIKELFRTLKGTNGLQLPTGAHVRKNFLQAGSMPRITVRGINNGIDSYCFSTNKNYRTFANFISVSFLGSVFYHPYEVSLDMKVHALIPLKINLNEYIAKFLIVSIKNSVAHFSYGNQLSSTDLVRLKLMLPINKNNNPDWLFMENFVRQEQTKQVEKIKNYYEAKLDKLFVKCTKLEKVKWKEFFIGGIEGIFNITATNSGIDKNKLSESRGVIPYITRTDMQNGIKLFVSDNQSIKYKKDMGNVITIGLDTQTVFYQEQPFYTGQNIQILSNENLNKDVALFIIPLIKVQLEKFSWGGNGATLGRLAKTKLMLPVDSFNRPNWSFMERNIKQERNKQIAKIKNYYKAKLSSK